MPKYRRYFKCSACGYEETIEAASVVVMLEEEIIMYGSGVDNCSNCDAMRPYDLYDNCLDEVFDDV